MTEEEEETERPRRRFGAAAYALVTAAIALVSAGIGLVFDLAPGLRPDPRERRGAKIEILAAEPEVRMVKWLERATTSDAEFLRLRRQTLRNQKVPKGASRARIQEALGIRGRAFYVQTTVDGLKRDDVELQWSLYDAKTKRRFYNDDFHDRPTSRLRQSTPTDQAVTLAWIPNTGDVDRVFARFEILDEDGYTLAIGDSEPWRGR